MSEHQGREFDGMQGGSDSDTALRQGGGMSFFQKGIKYLNPTEKNRVQGRILPARDNTLSKNDSAWATSVLPYRDVQCGLLDDLTKTPKFTAWYASFLGYKFFGRTQASLVSPQTLKALGGGVSVQDIADPIADCRNFARNSSNTDWKKLIEKEGNDKRAKAVIPHYSTLALFNMYCAPDKGEWATRIVVTSGGAVDDLKKKLCWQTPASQLKPHDPKWKDYLYGDITDMENGLIATLAPIQVGATTPTGFSFSNQDYTLNGANRHPVNLSELPNRYDMLSSKTLWIATYQELVDFLVDDGTIPYEIVKVACSAMANVPPPPKKNVAVSSPATQPANTGMPVGNTPTSYPAQTSTPGDDTKFWISLNGAVTATTAKDVAALVATGQNPQLLAHDQTGGWKTAADFGFTKPAPAPVTPPPPEPPVTPPPAPAAPLAPAAPEQPKPKRKFWMALSGATPVAATEDEVQAAVDSKASVMVMNHDQTGGWQKPDALGFKVDEIDMTPVPAGPAPETVPAGPTTPAAPAVPAGPPAGPTTPAAPSGPTGSLTEAEAAQLADFQARSVNPLNNPLKHEEMMLLIELTKKQAGVVG